jgi:hypothetical protein
VLWKNFDGRADERACDRATKTIKGFKKKDGSGTYDARLVINDEWKVRLSFDNLNDAEERGSKVASETKEPRKEKEAKPKEAKPRASKAKASEPKQ